MPSYLAAGRCKPVLLVDLSFERPHDNNTTNLGYKVKSIPREYYTSQKQESHITAVGGLTSI